MKENFFTFIAAFLINGIPYGVILYFINSIENLNQFIFSVIFFGFFMTIFQTFIFKSYKKNKQDKQ